LLFVDARACMVRCSRLVIEIFPNDLNVIHLALPRPAASPSAAALVFSLIFTSSAAAFIALQRETLLILAPVFA
jgi:hypothetical protein